MGNPATNRHAMTPPPDNKQIQAEEFKAALAADPGNPFLQMHAEAMEPDDDDGETDTCPTCEGSGTSWDGICKCLDCGGTGH